jgi:hypothetical protein
MVVLVDFPRLLGVLLEVVSWICFFPERMNLYRKQSKHQPCTKTSALIGDIAAYVYLRKSS